MRFSLPFQPQRITGPEAVSSSDLAKVHWAMRVGVTEFVRALAYREEERWGLGERRKTERGAVSARFCHLFLKHDLHSQCNVLKR